MAFSIKTDLEVEEIELNDQGDKISITLDDVTIFDKFAKEYEHIANCAEKYDRTMKEIGDKYKGKEVTTEEILEAGRARAALAEECTAAIDGIFGEGTIHKYLRKFYENIPDFLPSEYCFIEFLEKMTPVMEELFGREIKKRESLSKQRMSKYVPQDHKKPAAPRAKKK